MSSFRVVNLKSFHFAGKEGCLLIEMIFFLHCLEIVLWSGLFDHSILVVGIGASPAAPCGL